MKCCLMNKNTQVLGLEYNEEIDTFTNILEIYSIEYAPLPLFNAHNNKSLSVLRETNDWFKGRGIPSWRKDLSDLLENLGVQSTSELLNKAYGLSLSDQYWIKPENEDIEWKDINFFLNDFKYKGYLEASFSSNLSERINLYSPNNTTDGMVKKAWMIQDGNRVLVKDSYLSDRTEPINEWLASLICERLGIEHCDYRTYIYNQRLVSLCNNFVTENTEIIPAYDIFVSEKKPNQINDYEHYVSILEKHGVPNARSSVNDMFIIDYLMMNTDRHMKNFGVIRDVNSLNWLKTVPIFDTGQSMQSGVLDKDINFDDGYGKFFFNSSKKFSSYFKTLKLDKEYDLSCLKDVPRLYKEKLEELSEYINVTEQKRNSLVRGIEHRIGLLEKEWKYGRKGV